jgi:hypothetical protein
MFAWLLEKLAPGVAWRFKCPRTTEGIARHFYDRNLKIMQNLGTKAALPKIYEDMGETQAAIRRIAYIYGLEAGWNRQVLAEHKNASPEEIATTIHAQLWERARREAATLSDAYPPAPQPRRPQP